MEEDGAEGSPGLGAAEAAGAAVAPPPASPPASPPPASPPASPPPASKPRSGWAPPEPAASQPPASQPPASAPAPAPTEAEAGDLGDCYECFFKVVPTVEDPALVVRQLQGLRITRCVLDDDYVVRHTAPEQSTDWPRTTARGTRAPSFYRGVRGVSRVGNE